MLNFFFTIPNPKKYQSVTLQFSFSNINKKGLLLSVLQWQLGCDKCKKEERGQVPFHSFPRSEHVFVHSFRVSRILFIPQPQKIKIKKDYFYLSH